MVKPNGGAKKVIKKPKNGYQMPSHLPLNSIIQDVAKKQWKIGPSIGLGGFGEIYSACKADQVVKKTEDYPFVVKIEPHANGPLFVEMHFYMRNAKQEDVEAFQKEKGLKKFGMPYYIGSGSHELESIKHRFLVMPRYGKDLWSIFQEQGRKFPLHTVYRLCIQIIDVLQYIHKNSYVHADIKGGNILLGFGKGGDQQVFLVDFGLASHYTNKEFKPDPKKMHNGTIEYTSRDAHAGVATMRGDIEILAYNLIQWSGVELSWITANLLTNPTKVEQAKVEAMSDVGKFLNKLYDKSIPEPVSLFTKYASQLKYDQQPDYSKLKKMMEAGLKELSKTDTGALEFSALKAAKVEKPAPKRKSTKNTLNEDKKKEIEEKPVLKRSRARKAVVEEESEEEEVEIIPAKKNRGATKKVVSSPDPSPVKEAKKTKVPEVPETKSDNKKSNSEIGSITLNSDKSGKSKKKINLNFELNVSFDADVVVHFHRKNKNNPASDKKENGNSKVNVIAQPEDEIPNSDVDSPIKPKKTAAKAAKRSPSPRKPIASSRAGEYKGKLAKRT